MGRMLNHADKQKLLLPTAERRGISPAAVVLPEVAELFQH